MDHRDAYLCDVLVIPEGSTLGDVEAVLTLLRSHGLEVRSTQTEPYVIEGTVDASRLRELDDLPGIDYVRCVYSYIADYPAGDPRDQDG